MRRKYLCSKYFMPLKCIDTFFYFFFVVVLKGGNMSNSMHCVKCHTKPAGNIPCSYFCHKDQIPAFSQESSSCNCYDVLYMNDEYLILCRTRFKTWPGWKAPGPTLTIFCYQNNSSPDPLALSKEGVSENQLSRLMCVTMGWGML